MEITLSVKYIEKEDWTCANCHSINAETNNFMLAQDCEANKSDCVFGSASITNKFYNL